MSIRDLMMSAICGFLLLLAPTAQSQPSASAIFASGCFWCTEKDFESVQGVISAVSGYIGGEVDNPGYRQVSAGVTGHAEAVLVTYDPAKVSYQELLKVYWYSVDPFAKDKQFCDTGTQYRSAIFYQTAEQEKLARESLAALKQRHKITKQIQTEIVPASKFWDAEEYHQDYYKKNPVRYQFYRVKCGRDQRLEKLWGGMAHWKPETD